VLRFDWLSRHILISLQRFRDPSSRETTCDKCGHVAADGNDSCQMGRSELTTSSHHPSRLPCTSAPRSSSAISVSCSGSAPSSTGRRRVSGIPYIAVFHHSQFTGLLVLGLSTCQRIFGCAVLHRRGAVDGHSIVTHSFWIQ
jgi:hypothetical protein